MSRRISRPSQRQTDQHLDQPWVVGPPGVVLVLNGLFLHRDELYDLWELSVFLDVPFDVTAPRMAARDGSNPSPHHPSMGRYVDGQRTYSRAARQPHAPTSWSTTQTGTTQPSEPTDSRSSSGTRTTASWSRRAFDVLYNARSSEPRSRWP